MATSTKKKRTAVTMAKAPEKKTKIKSNPLDDLAQAMAGKDGVVEVLRFSSDDVIGHVGPEDIISTGSLALDKATGLGGFPRGRLVEVYGQPEVGKTTSAHHLVAAFQKAGGVAGIYDPEEKLDLAYAKDVGVNADDLLAIQPAAKTIEAGLAAFDRALTHWIDTKREKVPLLLVWDSIGGTSHDKEYKDPTNKEPGVPARELRRMMRVLTGKIARARAIVLLINQQYEIIGFTGFGPKRSTYGGGGIRYHASLRIEMVRTGSLKLPSGQIIGVEGLIKVFKNSLGIPQQQPYAIAYKRGFDNAWSIVEKLKEARYITVGGGQYKFHMEGSDPVTWAGGFAQLDQMMRDDEKLKDTLVKVYNALP